MVQVQILLQLYIVSQILLLLRERGQRGSLVGAKEASRTAPVGVGNELRLVRGGGLQLLLSLSLLLIQALLSPARLTNSQAQHSEVYALVRNEVMWSLVCWCYSIDIFGLIHDVGVEGPDKTGRTTGWRSYREVV